MKLHTKENDSDMAQWYKRKNSRNFNKSLGKALWIYLGIKLSGYWNLCFITSESYNTIHTSNSNSQPIWLEVSVCIFKYLIKGLISLKQIIYIIIVFITRKYGFRTVWSDLSQNNIITFRYALSSKKLNDRLYVLTEMIYYTDNISHVRRNLTRNGLRW